MHILHCIASIDIEWNGLVISRTLLDVYFVLIRRMGLCSIQPVSFMVSLVARGLGSLRYGGIAVLVSWSNTCLILKKINQNVFV